MSYPLLVSAMFNFLPALINKIRWFFQGVPVELPAYFVPSFRVVELHRAERIRK